MAEEEENTSGLFDPEYHEIDPHQENINPDQTEAVLQYSLREYAQKNAALGRLTQSAIKRQAASSAATQKSIESQLKYWLWRRKSILSAIELPEGGKYFLKFIPSIHHEKHQIVKIALELKEKLGADEEYLHRMINRTFVLAKDGSDRITVTKFIKRIVFDTLADVLASIRVKFVIDQENPASTVKMVDVYADALVDPKHGYAVKRIKTDDRGEVILPINPIQPSMAMSTEVIDQLESENVVTYFVQNRSYTVGPTSIPDVIQRRLAVLNADPETQITIKPIHMMDAMSILQVLTPDMETSTMLENQAYLKQVALNNNLEHYPVAIDHPNQSMIDVDEVENDGWLIERITLWQNAKRHILNCHIRHAEMIEQRHCDYDALTGEDEVSKEKLKHIKMEQKPSASTKKNMETLIKGYMQNNDELEADQSGKKTIKVTYQMEGELQSAIIAYHGPNRVAPKIGIRDMGPIIELALNLTVSQLPNEHKGLLETPIQRYNHQDFCNLFKQIWPNLFANIIGQADAARRSAIINKPLLKVIDPNSKIKTEYRYKQ